MRRPRHLSPEERALWDRVARRTERLHPEQPAPPQESRKGAPEPGPAPKPAAPLPEFRIGERAEQSNGHDILPGLKESLTSRPVAMDAKAHGRLKRGKLVPEARIDLHGMTLAQAHPALTAFVLSAQAAGKRLVLVITGKGRVRDDLAPMPARQGALRHEVPRWLSSGPMAGAVLQVLPAHRRHGGDGAYYVYLRRLR